MKKFNSSITFLRAKNLDETSKFYEEILNCPLVLDQGSCRIYETSQNGSYLGFCSHTTPPKDPGSVCLTFVVATKQEVDEWHQFLKERNVPIKNPPVEKDQFKIYNFFATDPNGYTIEIQAFLHPFPPE